MAAITKEELTSWHLYNQNTAPTKIQLVDDKWITADGELVVRDWFGNETFVANFNQDTSGSERTAGIYV